MGSGCASFVLLEDRAVLCPLCFRLVSPYLFTYLLSYLVSYLLVYLLAYLLTYSLTYLLTYLLTYSFTYLLTLETNVVSSRRRFPFPSFFILVQNSVVWWLVASCFAHSMWLIVHR